MIYEAVEIIFNTKTKPRLQGLTVCVRIYNLCILAISTKLVNYTLQQKCYTTAMNV